jgi:hypothetical protein
MSDLHRIREQIAGLACPYPNIIPFREGWECCKARQLAIIDAAIEGEGIPQRVMPASVCQIEAQTKQVRATLTDRVTESTEAKGE